MIRFIVRAAMIAATATLAHGAAAESASFDVSFAGIRAGMLAYDADMSGSTYIARGSARASGLAGAIFDARADVAANGKASGNAYRPAFYKEVVKEDGDTITRSFKYSGGVPAVRRDPPKEPRDHHAPPGRQAGTVDPMTAAFAILRDRPDGLACALDISVYDGAQRSRIELNRPARDGDRLICEGRYTRVAGFKPKEMAERTVWPLTMEYSRAGDVWQVEQLRFPTSFGAARITRR